MQNCDAIHIAAVSNEGARVLWKRLYAPADRCTPNSDPTIFYPVCHALGVKPRVLQMSDSTASCSVLFARLERRRSVRRIGYLAIPLPRMQMLQVVYGGHHVSGDAGRLEQVIQVLFAQHREIDQICFKRVPVDSDTYRALSAMKHVVIHSPEAHLALRLDATFDATMSRHSSKHRQRLRWEFRQLSTTVPGFRVTTLTQAHDIPRILREAETIGSQTYHAKVGGMVRADPVWEALLRSYAELGGLRGHFMYSVAGPVAFVLCANHRRRMHVLAMGHLTEHERYSPGKHLLLFAIQRACEDGMAWTDYGFGDAQYKRVYSTHVWDEADVSIYGPGVHSWLAYKADAALVAVARFIRNRCGVDASSRIRRHWRRMLSPAR